MRHQEYELQKAICHYLSLQYGNVLYLSDTVASVKLTLPQAARNKAIQKHGFKCPDLIILEPRGKYSGLFLELKIETPFKKDGGVKSNDHIKGQWKTIQDLKDRGYDAYFVWSFEMAKQVIDQYLKS